MPTHFVGLTSSDGERVFRDLLESNIPVCFLGVGWGGIEGIGKIQHTDLLGSCHMFITVV